MIDEALRCRRSSDALVDHIYHLEDTLALHERIDAVADFDLRRRFRGMTIHADVATAASGCRGRTRFVQPYGPDP